MSIAEEKFCMKTYFFAHVLVLYWHLRATIRISLQRNGTWAHFRMFLELLKYLTKSSLVHDLVRNKTYPFLQLWRKLTR